MRTQTIAGILAQIANVKLSPQEIGRYMRIGMAAYDGNLEPAIEYVMERLVQHRPSTATRVAATAQQVIKQHERQKAAFFRRFTSQTYGVYLVLGARGTGKTALALRLTEILERSTYAVGIPNDVAPSWITPVTIDDLIDTPNHSVVIIDDASLFASTSQARSPEMLALQELINICRHVDITIIITGQQAASIYKYVMDADALFLKPPSLLFKEFERAEVAKLFALAQGAFAQIPQHQRIKRLRSVFVVSPEYVGLMEFQKPKGWSDSLSKSKRRPETIDGQIKVLTDSKENPE